MLVSRGEQPLTVMCLTFLVTEKNDALTYNLGEEDKSELAHIVGELEDQRPIHSPSISLGEKSNKELTYAVGEQEDQIIHSSHNLGEKDETELTHIVGEQENQIIHSSHNLGEKDERELTHIAGEQEELVVGEEEEEESPGLEGVTACLVDPCRDVDTAAAVDGDHDSLRPDLDVGPADNAS